MRTQVVWVVSPHCRTLFTLRGLLFTVDVSVYNQNPMQVTWFLNQNYYTWEKKNKNRIFVWHSVENLDFVHLSPGALHCGH